MNLENSNTKCFIIHLKRADKRKSFVDDIIKNVPIDSEIINAVDGKILSKKDIDNILSHKEIYNPKYPFKINSGEIGCFLSHRKAWKKIVEQKLDAGLILEDDIRISPPTFNKSFNFSLKNIQKYKFIQFQVRKIKKKCKIIELDNELELLQPLPTFLRTSAQLVSYEAAVELLNKTTKIDRPVDTTLQIFWKTNIICYCINPSGISDHTFEAGGSTLSKKTSSSLKMSKNVKRLIYRTKIFYLSKYKKIKET